MRVIMRRKKAARSGLGALLAALMGLSACGGAVESTLEPAEWNLGVVSTTTVLEQEIEVGNSGRRHMEVRFVSTCDCLIVEPRQLELPKGARQSIMLHYDPSGDQGEVRMQVIVQVWKGRDIRRQMLPVFGHVLSPSESEGWNARANEAGQDSKTEVVTLADRPLFTFEYVYDPGCKGCEVFLARQMIALQQELGIRLRVVKRDINEPNVQEEYLHLLDALGEEERAYPAVVFDGMVLQGEKEIEREFGKLLQRSLERAAKEE